jgi:hypothetical protein
MKSIKPNYSHGIKIKPRGRQNPITEAEKERYLELIKNNHTSKEAATALGRGQAALRKATGQWVPKKKNEGIFDWADYAKKNLI